MSYVYSFGLCTQAITYLAGNASFEDRLCHAFSEMGVSRFGDTSDAVWKEWKDLQTKYHRVYQEKLEPALRIHQLEKIAEELSAVISHWMEYNAGQIGKGILSRRKNAA